MSDREHGNRTFSDDELLGVVRAKQPATTVEIADAFDLTRQGMYHRLELLKDAGHVTTEKYGNTLAWSLTGDG